MSYNLRFSTLRFRNEPGPCARGILIDPVSPFKIENETQNFLCKRSVVGTRNDQFFNWFIQNCYLKRSNGVNLKWKTFAQLRYMETMKKLNLAFRACTLCATQT